MLAQTTPADTTATAASQVSRRLDCRGELCPMPIYKTSMALAKMAAGERLEVICTDPGSLRDFPALARQSGHELIKQQQREGEQIFVLQKGER